MSDAFTPLEPAIRTKLDEMAKRYVQLRDMMSTPEVATNPGKLRDISKEYARLSKSVETYAALKRLWVILWSTMSDEAVGSSHGRCTRWPDDTARAAVCSRSRARSCSRGDPPGAPASATSRRSTWSRCPRRQWASSSRVSCLACPRRP